MKATISFELPKEDAEYEAAYKGMDMAVFLWDIDQRLRDIIKYNEEKHSEEYIKALQDFRDWFNEEKPILEHYE